MKEEDQVVIEAIRKARYAMMLLQGAEVKSGKTKGFLDFEREINNLTCALRILGLDVTFPVRTARYCM